MKRRRESDSSSSEYNEKGGERVEKWKGRCAAAAQKCPAAAARGLGLIAASAAPRWRRETKARCYTCSDARPAFSRPAGAEARARTLRTARICRAVDTRSVQAAPR